MEEKPEQVQHRTGEADVFRTKIFGIQDGLIGVGSIALGAAGFSHSSLLVLVTGLIATVAQAFSMGLGEFISTRVRMQVFQNEIKKESYEIENFPEKEREELISFYERKGVPREESVKIAEILLKNREVVLNEMMIHELKIFPEEFETPGKLGLLMALYLVMGGLIPLVPFGLEAWMGFGFRYALLASASMIMFTLVLFGVLSTKYTGLPKWKGALEQVGAGLLALAGSYVAGYLISLVIPINFLP